MLIKQENINNIFEIYKNVYDTNLAIALPNYEFYILDKGIIKKLNVDDVALLLNKTYEDIIEEYMRLYQIEKNSSLNVELENKKDERTGRKNK